MEMITSVGVLDNPMLGCVREDKDLVIKSNTTLHDMLAAAELNVSDTDLRNCDTYINRDLLVTKDEKTKATLFGFTNEYSLMEQMLKLKANGLQPAVAVELLNYSVMYPDDAERYRIYAAGSRYHGSEDELLLPVLETEDGVKWFRLVSFGRPTVDWRLLCVPIGKDFKRRTQGYL